MVLEEIGENETELIAEVESIRQDKRLLEEKLHDQCKKEDLQQILLEEKSIFCDQMQKERDILQQRVETDETTIAELHQKQKEITQEMNELKVENEKLVSKLSAPYKGNIKRLHDFPSR